LYQPLWLIGRRGVRVRQFRSIAGGKREANLSGLTKLVIEHLPECIGHYHVLVPTNWSNVVAVQLHYHLDCDWPCKQIIKVSATCHAPWTDASWRGAT
jgi:hypothetical protein